MPNHNHVTLIGNLTRDPETRAVGQSTVTSTGIAVTRKWRGADKEWKEKTSFIDITAWGARGEAMAKYVRKGDPLFVSGYLDMDEWEDKATGGKRTKLKVVVDDFQFLKPRDGDGERPRTGGNPSAVRKQFSDEEDPNSIPF